MTEIRPPRFHRATDREDAIAALYGNTAPPTGAQTYALVFLTPEGDDAVRPRVTLHCHAGEAPALAEALREIAAALDPAGAAPTPAEPPAPRPETLEERKARIRAEAQAHGADMSERALRFLGLLPNTRPTSKD